MELAELVIASRSALRQFDKKHYPDDFSAFERAAAPMLRDMEGRESADCARELIEALEKAREGKPRREQKLRAFENKQALTLFLVPAALRQGGWAADFAETLCREWNARYPKNRFYPGSYEDILSGFGTTILGFAIPK